MPVPILGNELDCHAKLGFLDDFLKRGSLYYRSFSFLIFGNKTIFPGRTTMNEYNPERQFLLVMEFFKENPALALSISYLLLTLCGIFYSVSFYDEFGIQILQFAEISDLLIVGISEPLAVLMFFGGLVVAYLSEKFNQFGFGVRSRWLKKPKSLKRTLMLSINCLPKSSLSQLAGMLLLFILYSHLFVSLFANWRAEAIGEGNGLRYSIVTESSQGLQDVVLLGTTTNYVLTLDPNSGQGKVTPVEKVLEMLPIRTEEINEENIEE